MPDETNEAAAIEPTEPIIEETPPVAPTDPPAVPREETAANDEFLAEIRALNARLAEENSPVALGPEPGAVIDEMGFKGRVIAAGTTFQMNGVEVTIAAPALVQFPGFEEEYKFVLLFVGNDSNFQKNVAGLKNKYSTLTGAVLPYECHECGGPLNIETKTECLNGHPVA